MVFAKFKRSGEVEISGGQQGPSHELPGLSTDEIVMDSKSPITAKRWKIMFALSVIAIFMVLLPLVIWYAIKSNETSYVVVTSKEKVIVNYGNETCDFEYTLGKEKCHWTQDKSDDFDWTRHSGSTPSYGGPSHDHTWRNNRDVTGHYLYIMASTRKYMDKARLVSRLRPPTAKSCLTFWYNLNGRSIGNLTAYSNISGMLNVLWRRGGDLKNRWIYASVEFNSSMPYQLILEGTVGIYRGSVLFGDIAMDDISIIAGACPPQEPLACNFSHSINATYAFFMSPFYPEYYPNNALCYYHLETHPDKIFIININYFVVQQSPSCVNDSLKMYEKGVLRHNMCGSFSRRTLTSSESKVLFVFKTDGSVSSQGFSARFNIKDKPCIQSYNTPSGFIESPFQGKQSGKACKYHITVDRAKSIKFNIVVISRSSSCSYGMVKIYEDRYTSRNIKATYCSNVTTIFQSYSHNVTIEFQPVGTQSIRFYANFSTTNKVCNFTLTQMSIRFASPNYPLNYPNNVYCEYHFKAPQNKAMQIVFAYFTLEQSQSCAKDSVKLYEKNILKQTFCGIQNTRRWYSTESEVLMVFKTDASGTASGFFGVFSLTNKPCRYTYTSLKGYFTSPSYPANYPDNMRCNYNIKVKRNATIEIDFQIFDIEDASTCNRDYVKIYEVFPSRSELSATFCGQVTRKYQSKSNEVLVEFKSDGSVKRRGFYASYAFVDAGSANQTCKEPSPTCNYILSATIGNFSSPQFPRKYSNNTCCTYQITAQEGKSIKLDFVNMSLEYEPRCNYDTLKIYEGDLVNGTLVRTFCGNGRKTYTSVGSKLYVLFKTDFSNTFQGFFARYNATISKGVS